MNHEIEKEVQKIVENVNRNIKAEKIFLFGSYAYGTPNQNSDIDICIITEDNKRKIDIMRTLRKALFKEINHPLDILVYKNNEFNERAGYTDSIEKIIKEKGVPIYG